ncbi:hypothetical protein HPG69_006779 [Diceros bicornis minor]|uniref:Uncharacterized protein n=1 Tax=Diceros bicornis minor TaxID=77932 RepID=A0A7J7EET5_DICBM|nr:hypothetical protein HPG69_006779 [Diceros bicornis minor]
MESLRDPDLNVRRATLAFFNSAVHNKPSLVRDLLDDILPLLYQETKIRRDLIREAPQSMRSVGVWGANQIANALEGSTDEWVTVTGSAAGISLAQYLINVRQSWETGGLGSSQNHAALSERLQVGEGCAMVLPFGREWCSRDVSGGWCPQNTVPGVLAGPTWVPPARSASSTEKRGRIPVH